MTSQSDANQAIQLYYDGDIEGSEGLCRGVLQSDPDQPVALHTLGLIALNSDRANEAIDLISRVIEIQPDDPSAYNNLGSAYLSAGQYELGLASFKKSNELSPGDLGANLNMGVAYEKMGWLDEAISCFKNVLKIAPDDARAADCYDQVLLGLDNPDDTVMVFGDGIRIKLPDTLQQLTPFVIREQLQWFEHDIHFVNTFIQPGMQVIDIGANFGVYTLSMAKELQGKGRIWAFEPTSETADYLVSSVKENGFTTVEVVRAALSNTSGTARLATSRKSETNRLSDNPDVQAEPVAVMTLDGCMDDFGWEKVDFLKLDAEGHEENIIKGGVRFFEIMSPLVMFEAVDMGAINWSGIDGFHNMGYRLYSHVPGLGILVPFVEGDGEAGPELNLFCCKDGTASALEKRNLLVTQTSMETETFLPTLPGDWAEGVQNLPCNKRIFGNTDLLATPGKGAESGRYLKALRLFVISKSEDFAAVIRYKALAQSLTILIDLTAPEDTAASRLLTLARVCSELHDRPKLQETLARLESLYERDNGYRVDEPFLPIDREFDNHDPRGDVTMSAWILAQVLDRKVTYMHYSSYLTGMSSLADLDRIEATGFMREGMKRRRILIRERYGLDAPCQTSPIPLPEITDVEGNELCHPE